MSYGVPFGYPYGDSGADAGFTLSATIEQRITEVTYQRFATIEQRIYTPLQLSATIEQQIIAPSFVLSAVIEQRITQLTTLSATIEQQVYGSLSGIWSPVVYIGGVDYSDQVVGQISITHEERASSIARLSIFPADGAIDLLSWVGLQVTVDYQDSGWQTRRFTGIVATPEYVPFTGLINFTCSADMQGGLEAKSREEIAAIMPDSEWSADVFDDDADGWQYAQDRISTIPASLWTDANRAIRVTDWAAKATPDFTFTDADVKPERVSITHASNRDIVNRVRVELDYRFFNLRQREIHFHFKYTDPFCTFLRQGFNWPSRDMVRSAADGNSWTLQSLDYVPLPEPQAFTCDGDAGGQFAIYWGVNPQFGGYVRTGTDNYIESHCMGADFSMSKRWAQTVTENYILDITAPNSIEASGEIGVQEAYGVESKYDTNAWDLDQEYEGVLSGASLHPSGSGDINKEADTDRRTDMETAQRVILGKARTEILGSHRLNEVTFPVLMRPHLNLSHTIKLNSSSVIAQGKVKRLVETLGVATGQAVCEITLAISRHGGTGTVSTSPLDPADRPDATEETPHDKHLYLDFRIGGGESSPEHDDDWNGYTTNWYYDPDNPNPSAGDPNDVSIETYPERMVVEAPEIEEAAVDATVLAAPESYTIDIPQDTLTLTK